MSHFATATVRHAPAKLDMLRFWVCSSHRSARTSIAAQVQMLIAGMLAGMLDSQHHR